MLMNIAEIALVLLALPGQHLSATQHETESESDPPAFVLPSGRSHRLVVPWGGFTSYQISVDALGNNVVGDAANEPSIGIDPNDPNRMAVGWRQFDSVTSNFRQAGYAYSINGGLSWSNPGPLDPGVYRTDPVLGTRSDSLFYYLSLFAGSTDDFFTSSSGGSSWTRIFSQAWGGDKEWFAVDNTTGPGHGYIYQAWSDGWNIGQFTRSKDGGATWLNPINPPQRGIWVMVDLDAAGAAYLSAWTGSAFTLSRSTNANDGGVTPTFDLTRSISLGGNLVFQDPINPAGLMGQPNLVIDRSVGTPSPTYLMCSVRTNGSNPCDVMLSRSLDRASTWGAPVRINDDLLDSGNYHWMSALAVSPTGRLDAVWNDTRNEPTHLTSALYYAYSLDGGQHFSANIQVSPSFAQGIGYPNQDKIGDYMGIASNELGANIAYSATFNNEEDVYYLRVPTPVVIPPTGLSITGRGPFSGYVDSLAAVDGKVLTMFGSRRFPNSATQDVTVTANTNSPSPKALLFNIVAKSGLVGVTARAALFNWTTQSYEIVGATALGQTNTYLSLLAPGNSSRFVEPGTGRLRATVHFEPPPGALRDWLVDVDQAVWHVIP